MCSVVQPTEEGDAPLDPVIYRPVSGQMNGKDKVGRMTGGGQGTSPFAGLVQRADVVPFSLELGFYACRKKRKVFRFYHNKSLSMLDQGNRREPSRMLLSDTQSHPIMIIILGSCKALISVRLDTPGAPDYYPGFRAWLPLRRSSISRNSFPPGTHLHLLGWVQGWVGQM